MIDIVIYHEYSIIRNIQHHSIGRKNLELKVPIYLYLWWLWFCHLLAILFQILIMENLLNILRTELANVIADIQSKQAEPLERRKCSSLVEISHLMSANRLEFQNSSPCRGLARSQTVRFAHCSVTTHLQTNRHGTHTRTGGHKNRHGTYGHT